MIYALIALRPKPVPIVSKLLSIGHMVVKVVDVVQNNRGIITVGAVAIPTEVVLVGNRQVWVVSQQIVIRGIAVVAAQDIARL